MALNYYSHQNINPDRWNAAIRQSAYPLVYAMSWFLDRVSPGWSAIIEDDYHAVMPLPVKQKYGIHYIARPPFCQQLGIFASSAEINCSGFINAIPNRYKLIDLSFNRMNTSGLPQTNTSMRKNYELYLHPSYETIYKKYSSYTRRKLRMAQRNRLSVVTDVSAADVLNLFMQNKGKEIKGLGREEYRRIEAVMLYASEQKSGLFYGTVDENGVLCAAGFFLKSFNRYIYLFSGTNAKGRESAGNFLFLDRFIHDHCNSPFILDFEGSIIPSLATFYEGFGSEVIVYPHIRINRLPWPIRWIIR